MKNLSVRLFVLVSIGLLIYFFTPKNNNKTQPKENNTNEVVATTESEQVEEIQTKEEEIQTKEEINPILIEGQIKTYSKGDINYIVELDTLDRIVITKVVPSKMDEGWFWVRNDCKYTNKHIYVDWITTEYYIKNNELIVVESGKSTKFNLIEVRLNYR